ncbi:MAG TPA: glycosyltransferase family 2 protein [Candidatus Dojkabacteria bacterium]|nr:glycosyltransferase family 2 protein [Candidatus Dojkabacteria bacterium]
MLKNLNKDITISSVIPLYNESKTLEKVIKIVHSYPYIQEIVAVNDGSTDNTLELLRRLEKELPKLRVIDQQPNQGKAAAVVNGVKNAKGEVIIMTDGDLLTLKHKHFDSLLEDILSGEYEMTILDKGSDRFSAVGPISYAITRPLGGERAFWKKEFLKIPIKGDERYGLETLMNLYYVDNHKKIKSIYTPDLESVTQLKKQKNPVTGLFVLAKMVKDMMSVRGVSGYLHQTVNLEEDRLSKLYNVKEKSKYKSGKKFLSIIIFSAGMILSILTFIYLISKNMMNIKKLIKGSKS